MKLSFLDQHARLPAAVRERHWAPDDFRVAEAPSKVTAADAEVYGLSLEVDDWASECPDWAR